jgi:integrase
LSAVLLKYHEDRTDKLASKKHARLAGRTFLACWGMTVKVGEITLDRQKQFVEWSAARNHSLGYIARNLSVLAAAFNHAKLDTPIISKEKDIASRWAVTFKPRLKRFTPSDDDLARLFSTDLQEEFFRWLVISLLSGARPSAAVDFTPGQRNRESGTISLLPDDRTQNKKYRATVREPRMLTGWLDVWETDMRAQLLAQNPKSNGDISKIPYVGYASVESVQTAIERIRDRPDVALPKFSAYSCRHKVATVMRRARLPREERELQLGHARPEGYGEWDPDYLAGVADCLDAWFIRLQAIIDALAAKRGAERDAAIAAARVLPVNPPTGRAQLGVADVISIREKIVGGLNNREIARTVDVGDDEVSLIRRGKAWGDTALDRPYDSLRKGPSSGTPGILPTRRK